MVADLGKCVRWHVPAKAGCERAQGGMILDGVLHRLDASLGTTWRTCKHLRMKEAVSYGQSMLVTRACLYTRRERVQEACNPTNEY